MMKVSIILAHPTPGSFNHAIADIVVETLRRLGQAPTLHDLYAEEFDPVLPTPEISKDATLPPVIEQHCTELDEADGLVIIHPNYWSAPPAILRGWTDRVLRPGRAYNFVPDGQGGAKSVGLLRARVGLVLNTANTPQDKEEALFGDPLETHWLKVVFGLCGIPVKARRNFAPVVASSPDQRSSWLKDVVRLVEEHFADARSGLNTHAETQETPAPAPHRDTEP